MAFPARWTTRLLVCPVWGHIASHGSGRRKEGSFHRPGATLTRTAIWCSRGVCRAANGASLIRRFDRRTREELMDDLSNVPLGSERRRVLTLGLGMQELERDRTQAYSKAVYCDSSPGRISL
ncbi:uncharacterized protein LOC135828143 isoform X1 [Sycon ciliatum]|uniref:uncharacterized protein LOC135828143 isoform X1 n=1 Tax=Sycon ciliatum TaxID=27933 RepID=UPI0031F6B5A5